MWNLKGKGKRRQEKKRKEKRREEKEKEKRKKEKGKREELYIYIYLYKVERKKNVKNIYTYMSCLVLSCPILSYLILYVPESVSQSVNFLFPSFLPSFLSLIAKNE